VSLPIAPFALPWDDAAAPHPVDALRDARAALGDRFWVHSGATQYLFVFDEPGLRAFYALPERDASKGLADYRMLVRKLPDELFAERRTFAHDLFGAQEVEGYLDDLDAAIAGQLAIMGDRGTFDVFDWSRTVGHRLALACWCGRDTELGALVPDMEVLDGAEAFVRPADVEHGGGAKTRELAALRRVEGTIRARLADDARAPSFLDVIAGRWSDVDDPAVRAAGVAGDVVLLHVATMTNLFAALGWTLALVLLHDGADGADDPALEWCALEAIRIGQRSIMLREVLRPVEFLGESLERGPRRTQIATMLPLTNESLGDYEPLRWADRALRHDARITTFGHGSHRCPAARFSTSAIVRTVARLRAEYELRPCFTAVRPLPGQIGGVARAADACPVDYQRRTTA
jgi:cytochrome P450